MLNKLFGGIFLIAGTSIGAGMLGIPIKILGINFNISIITFLYSWFIILLSSLAMLEISFWFKKDSNIISISKILFGKKITIIISIIYILFFYALIIAYISGSYSMLIETTNFKNNIFSKIFFITPFLIINFYGINVIDKINKLFFLSSNILYNFNISYFFYNKFKYRKYNIYKK